MIDLVEDYIDSERWKNTKISPDYLYSFLSPLLQGSTETPIPPFFGSFIKNVKTDSILSGHSSSVDEVWCWPLSSHLTL